MNLTTQQLSNGRFRIIATDYNYSGLDNATVSAILWRTFATDADARLFITTIAA